MNPLFILGPIIFLMITAGIMTAEAKLLGITTPKKNDAVYINSTLTVSGFSAPPNATQSCNVEFKLNHGHYQNANPISPNNYTQWSKVNNDTILLGPNHMEAQLSCTSGLLKHLTRNFTGIENPINTTANTTLQHSNNTTGVKNNTTIVFKNNSTPTPSIQTSPASIIQMPSSHHSSSHSHHKTIHIHISAFNNIS